MSSENPTPIKRLLEDHSNDIWKFKTAGGNTWVKYSRRDLLYLLGVLCVRKSQITSESIPLLKDKSEDELWVIPPIYTPVGTEHIWDFLTTDELIDSCIF